MKYILQPYTTPASRSHCPQCNDRRKTFKLYIDTETGDSLADHVGRCDRENSCGYHYKPGQYFEEQRRSAGYSPFSINPSDRRVWRRKSRRPATTEREVKDFLCIHPDIVNASFKQYDRNNFVQYLIRRFGLDKADEVVGRYRIGTAKHWPGATVFWQLDTLGQARTGKVMLYDTETGKRVKKPFNHITWVHSLLVNSGSGSNSNDQTATATATFKLKQCLFGEHLLKESPEMPVAIVESEKTAVIASAHEPTFIWLAAGSISNLSPKMCQVLKGRNVTLYPDLGAYDQWLVKARLLQIKIPRTTFNVSDVLERHASDADRKQGLDIGDFL